MSEIESLLVEKNELQRRSTQREPLMLSICKCLNVCVMNTF